MRRRRFGRVFELDRNGSGTPDQRKAVRAVFAKYVEYKTRFDMVLYALDRARNLKGRQFIPIIFVDSTKDGWLGFGSPSTILLSDKLVEVERTLLHELGHVVGWNLLTPRDGSEDWARAFRTWVQDGQPDGDVWDRLKVVVDRSRST